MTTKESVFLIVQGNCTYELTVAVKAYISLVKDKAR